MDGPPTTPGGQAEELKIRGRNPPTHGPRGFPAGTRLGSPYQIIAGGGVTLRHRAGVPVAVRVPIAAASEQWTGWSWPARASSCRSGGWSSTDGWGSKNALDTNDFITIVYTILI